MKLATAAKILATGMALLILVFEASAGDPIFVKWLVMDDPGDETIRVYWQRAEAGELSPPELVDLGTMLFYRGWPNDAVRYFREALDEDPDLSDAWFRIGLVEHHSGDLSGARSAYKKCLKKQSGHAWANFYLGLLEEQTGDAEDAMKHFETAFRHAPELADPKINPEILSSKLQLGAQVRHFDSRRFEKTMPMPYLDPAAVRRVRRQFESTASATSSAEQPEPAAAVTPTPIPSRPAAASGIRTTPTSRRSGGSEAGAVAVGAGAARSGSATPPPDTGGTPYGIPPEAQGHESSGTGNGRTAPRIGDTSPEASLGPAWPGLYELARGLV